VGADRRAPRSQRAHEHRGGPVLLRETGIAPTGAGPGLNEDAAATTAVLDEGEPTIIVAHSYGGMVASQAGEHPAVCYVDRDSVGAGTRTAPAGCVAGGVGEEAEGELVCWAARPSSARLGVLAQASRRSSEVSSSGCRPSPGLVRSILSHACRPSMRMVASWLSKVGSCTSRQRISESDTPAA